jgi:hypothetical protein
MDTGPPHGPPRNIEIGAPMILNLGTFAATNATALHLKDAVSEEIEE